MVGIVRSWPSWSALFVGSITDTASQFDKTAEFVEPQSWPSLAVITCDFQASINF